MAIFPANVVSDLSEKAKDFWAEKAAVKGVVIEHEEEQTTSTHGKNDTTISEEKPEAVTHSEAETEEHEASKGGYGWKTVKQVAEEEGIDLETALENLEKAGIKADENTTIRTIMDETGKTAHDLIEIMKGESQ